MKKEASQINDSKIDSEKEATKASNGSFENFCPAEVGLEESEIPLPKDTLSLESPESVKGGMPGVSVNSGRDLKVKTGRSRARIKKVSPGLTKKQSSQSKNEAELSRVKSTDPRGPCSVNTGVKKVPRRSSRIKEWKLGKQELKGSVFARYHVTSLFLSVMSVLLISLVIIVKGKAAGCTHFPPLCVLLDWLISGCIHSRKVCAIL